MKILDVSIKMEAILKNRFPTVLVRPQASEVQLPDGELLVSAIGIPDARLEEFALFMMSELPDLRDKAGLPWVTLIPYSESEARIHFPDLFAPEITEQLTAEAYSVLVVEEFSCDPVSLADDFAVAA